MSESELPIIESACGSCSVKDCPQRNAHESGEDCGFTPKRMVFSSFLVFFVPLIFAAVGAGIVGEPQWLALLCALGGFFIGLLLARFIIRIWQ